MKRIGPIILLSLLCMAMRINAYTQDSLSHIHYLSLRHDNDFFNVAGQGTDEYYTAGIYVQYSFVSPAHKNILNKILYSPDHKDPSFLTIGLTQWMYTPDKIESAKPIHNDYPYCGVLFLDLTRENLLSDRKLFRSELWLGMLGPAALADQTQELVHHLIKSVAPEGWGGQIPNYPVVNYNLYYESNIFSLSRILKMNGLGYLQMGSLMNTAQVGLDFLISSERDNFFPDRVYRLYKETSRRARFYLQFIPIVKFIGSNSILQGGPFDNREFYHINAGDLKRVVFQGSGVMGIRTRRFSIQYSQVIESPEFQAVHRHVYGTFSLTFGM